MGSKSCEVRVSEILIFGKIAEDKSDMYSDVDIRIVSKDPGLTQRNLHKLLTTLSPIRETFVLASDINNFAEMIMLEDYPPYQKIDISICRKGYGLRFSTITSVYKNPNASGDNTNCIICPTVKNCEYNLDNFLFGVPRMTKCFFRRDFDMYRRWMGTTNALIILLYESYFGWQDVNNSKGLDAPNSKLLFEALKYTDKQLLQLVLPLNGKLDLPESFINNLEWFIELSRKKAKAQKLTLNEKFCDYITHFAKTEIQKI